LIVPLLLLGFAGSLGQGSVNLYSMGLDLIRSRSKSGSCAIDGSDNWHPQNVTAN
jgi:hypothetical protein